jgi:hypothetical protein
VVAFMVGFLVLVFFLTSYYILPATEAFMLGTIGEKRQIDAYSSLLMYVLLVILLSGLLLTFRVGRFFFPRNSPQREKTQYVDAWAEAGRRAQPPPSPDSKSDE